MTNNNNSNNNNESNVESLNNEFNAIYTNHLYRVQELDGTALQYPNKAIADEILKAKYHDEWEQDSDDNNSLIDYIYENYIIGTECTDLGKEVLVLY